MEAKCSKNLGARSAYPRSLWASTTAISSRSSINCYLAYPSSTCAKATQWNAKTHDAYHGYSQVSGIEMTTQLDMCFQCALRPCRWLSGGGAEAGSPDSHRATS